MREEHGNAPGGAEGVPDVAGGLTGRRQQPLLVPLLLLTRLWSPEPSQ